MKVLVLLRLIFWIVFAAITSILLILKLRRETLLQKKETMWRDDERFAGVAKLTRREICFWKILIGYDVIVIFDSCLLILIAVGELVKGSMPWMTTANISLLWPIVSMLILSIWQHKEYKRDKLALLKEITVPVIVCDDDMLPKFTEEEYADVKEFYKAIRIKPDKKN